MTDVRLTATNPEDSSVVPVACNSKGELLVTEPTIEAIDNALTVNGPLTVNSPDAVAAQRYALTLSDSGVLVLLDVTSGRNVHTWTTAGKSEHVRNSSNAGALTGLNSNSAAIYVDSAAGQRLYAVDWSGQVTASRLLVALEPENSAHYVTEALGVDGDEASEYKGPTLDVAEELEFLRTQVRALMEKLKMSPEGGWPVWDGSDS